MMNPKLGNEEQICSVQRVQVTDGRARGARLIYCSNGKLNFVLGESNGLDILRLWHEGTNIGFVSKAGHCTTDFDFCHNFNAGMLYTCGLDAIGVIDGHYPHGRYHLTPAEIEEIKANEEGISIVAKVKEAALFGANLEVTRRIVTQAGAGSIQIFDKIKNLSFVEQQYSMLYHVNAGYPMADVGSRIEGNVVRSLPRTAWSAENMDRMFEVEPPADGMEENCYFHQTEDGILSLVNPTLGKRLTVKSSYRKFVHWKSRASGDYAIGLEPASCWLDEHHRYLKIRPGHTHLNRLEISISEI